jgi:acetyl esterase
MASVRSRLAAVLGAMVFFAASLQLLGASSAQAATTYANVQYGPASGTANQLDVYVPSTGAGPFPALLLVHGGGWTRGDKSSFDKDAAGLAKIGIVGVPVNYRLAPKYVYPAQLDDLQLALQWLRAHAGQYKVDPSRIGALGTSAGAHLAALLATYGVGATNGSGRVVVVGGWSGAYDFSTMVTASMDGTKISTFLGCDVTTCPAKWADASPANHLDPTDPPMYMANGTSEEIPTQQPQDMSQRLKADFIPYELQWVPGSKHGMAYQSQVWTQTIQFLTGYLR